MRRRVLLAVGAVALVVAAALVALFVVFPGGAPSAEAALLDRVADARPDRDTPRILVGQPWGDGQLVLAAYSKDGERRLGLGFAVEQGRGWRLTAYTEETAELEDILNVGSLLVASSGGGEGQPAWSAVVGELSDPRVDRIEIRWSSGETSSARRRNDAYLVVEEGETTPLEAHYVTKDGTEIARVPVEERPE